MVDQPNLSREGLEKLEFVGRQGDQLVYKGASKLYFVLLTSILFSGKPVVDSCIHLILRPEDDHVGC